MKERRYNLDLLRILSMFFIVALHYLGVGGAYYNIYDGNLSLITYNYCIASWLEALAIVGVNCFVLISGYFLINSNFKVKKIGQIYFTTIFYSVIFFIISVVFDGFSFSNLISSVLPVSMSTYWFITVYIALYLLSPFINILCNHLTQQQHRNLILILVVIFSVWKCVLPIAETLDTRKGYSLTWFIVLYICGAYIAKYGVVLFKKNIYNLLAYFAITVVMVAAKMICILLSTKVSMLAQGQNLLYHYDSITVFLASVFIFVFFSRLKCDGKFLNKTIKFIAPSVFSVYLIHENFLWREFLWNKIIKASEMITSPVFIIHFLVSVIAVFFACILIDQVRKLIFYYVPKFVKRITQRG